MSKLALQFLLWMLISQSGIILAADEPESSSSTLDALLSLGQAVRTSESDLVVRRYLDVLKADKTTVEVLLDQVYPRQARPGEVSAVRDLLSRIDSEEFSIRESATESLTNLGLSTYLLIADLIDEVSPESAARLAKIRQDLIRIRGSRLVDLNSAAKEIFAILPRASIREIARGEWTRLSSDVSHEDAAEFLKPEDPITGINWMNSHLLGSLRTSDRVSDLELFASSVLHAAENNPALAVQLFSYFYDPSPNRDENWLVFDFSALGIEIMQVEEIPYNLWELALELAISGKYESISKPSDSGDPFEILEENSPRPLRNLLPDVARVLIGLLEKSDDRRKDALREVLRRSHRDAPRVVKGMLDELETTEDLDRIQVLTMYICFPVYLDYTKEVAGVYLKRVKDDSTSEELKNELLKTAPVYLDPKSLSELFAPFLISGDEKLSARARRLFVGSNGRAISKKNLKMVAELAQIAESDSSEAMREAAGSLYANWRRSVIDQCIGNLEAAIAKSVIPESARSSAGLPGCLRSVTLDLLANPLVACPPEKLLPYWKKLLNFDDARRDAALYGILQQPSSRLLFTLAEGIADECLESESAISIVRKWVMAEPADHPFLAQAKSHPNPHVRKKLEELIAGTKDEG